MFLNVAASVHECVLELSGLGFGSLHVSVFCCLDKSSKDVLDVKPVELNMVVKNLLRQIIQQKPLGQRGQ